MLSWAARRRLLYFALVAGFLLLLFSVLIFSFFSSPASCEDGKQNQGEAGVDCGGPCPTFCEENVADIVVRWSRFANVGEGLYDAAALLENPNPKAGLERIAYSFSLHDAENLLVAERSGTTFVNPGEVFAVYEHSIKTGERVPKRAFFTFEPQSPWMRTEKEKPMLGVEEKLLEDEDAKPRLSANLLNHSLVPAEEIIAVALLFDVGGNLVAVGKTEVERIGPDAEQSITFVWPQPFAGEVTRIDILPRTNVTDTQ